MGSFECLHPFLVNPLLLNFPVFLKMTAIPVALVCGVLLEYEAKPAFHGFVQVMWVNPSEEETQAKPKKEKKNKINNDMVPFARKTQSVGGWGYKHPAHSHHVAYKGCWKLNHGTCCWTECASHL